MQIPVSLPQLCKFQRVKGWRRSKFWEKKEKKKKRRRRIKKIQTNQTKNTTTNNNDKIF